MRRLSDADLLDLWERGNRLHPLDRALLLLAAALPDTAYEHLADWPLGRRNQALAKIRSDCFGPNIVGWMACPHCGEKLEFQMSADLFNDDAKKVENPRERVEMNGLTFRLPTSRDLAKAAKETDPMIGAVRIAESCLVGARPKRDWTSAELAAIGENMAAADPLGETRLAFVCPNCGKESEESLDIASLFWAEVEVRVRRVLSAIHALASAYGWTESEILSLSNTRRAWYLEMVL